MPTDVIPLVGVHNQRGVDVRNTIIVSNKDQRFINSILRTVRNPITGKLTVYTEKRPGFNVGTIISGATIGYGVFEGRLDGTLIESFGTGIFANATNVGSITGSSGIQPNGISSTLIASKEYILINEGSGNAFYRVSDATVTSVTGDTTNTSAVVTNVSSTTGLYSGQPISGTGIPASTRILTVDSATQITMTANATATNAGVTITVTRLAKITDTDFPTDAVGGFAFVGGYAFVMTLSGRVHNSDLNTVHLYGANSYISADMSPDRGRCAISHRNAIVAFGIGSMEVFRNVGNPTGSPLSRVPELSRSIGTLSSVASAKDTLYWIGQAEHIFAGIFEMNGFEPQKISTPEVDAYFEYYARSRADVTLYCSASMFGGHGFVFCSVSSVPTSVWVYSVTDKIWVEWAIPTELQGMRYLTYSNYSDTLLYVNGNDGSRYILDSRNNVVYQDGITAYTNTIQTSKVTHGTQRRKFVNSIRLNADVQTSGTCTLESNDNDYATASWVTLGTFDLTSMNKRITRCGSYKGGRAYRLTHSANTAFRAESVEIDYEVGSN